MIKKIFTKKQYKKIIVVSFVFLLLYLVFFYLSSFSLQEYLNKLKVFIEDLGIYGPFVFICIYTLATTLFTPALGLTLLGGILFGPIYGFIYVMIAAMLSAFFSFIIARYIFKNFITQKLKHRKNFQRLESLTSTYGDKIVFLFRFSSIFPFFFLNYGFGLTNVSLKPYMIWTFLGTIPSVAFYVIGTDTLINALKNSENSKLIFIITGLLLFLFSYLTYKIKQKLKQK